MLAVLINDSAFAVVLGCFLTSWVALQAWTVKTLVGVNTRTEANSERIDRLEGAYWQRGAAKVKFIIGIGLIMVALLWGALYAKVETDAQRRDSACESRQNLYDGQFVYTHYLAEEFRITPAQETAAVKRLRKALGPRPVC